MYTGLLQAQRDGQTVTVSQMEHPRHTALVPQTPCHKAVLTGSLKATVRHPAFLHLLATVPPFQEQAERVNHGATPRLSEAANLGDIPRRKDSLSQKDIL